MAGLLLSLGLYAGPAHAVKGDDLAVEVAAPPVVALKAPSDPEETEQDRVQQALASPGTEIQRGLVSWYGRHFKGRRTACGLRFDPKQLTMAHPSLPCGTRVLVVNPGNRQSVLVTVSDRGPFGSRRIADVSKAAAKALGILGVGSAILELQALDGGASENEKSPVPSQKALQK